MATQPSYNKLKIANPSLEGNQITYLTQDIAIGATSLSILSKSGFLKAEHRADTYFFVLIGKYGQEKSEIVKVTADDTVNQSLTITACKYSHSASDAITFIPYDKVRYVGRVASGAGGTTIVDIDIDATKQSTEYVYEGTDYGFFVVAYYNSATDEISGYSEEITSTSFTHRSVERIIKSAARKALTTVEESEDSKLNWDIAIELVQDGLDEIVARKRKWPFLHSIDATTLTTVGVQYVDQPSNMSSMDKVKYDNKKVSFASRVSFDQQMEAFTNNIPNGVPTIYTFKNNKIYFYPIPNEIKTVTFEYFKSANLITNLSTEIDIPFVVVLVYYVGSQMAYIRGNDKRGDKLYAMYGKLLEQQVEEFTGPEQAADAEQVEQTSGIYGDNFGDNY